MKMTMTQSNAREIRNGETLPRRAAIIFIVFLGIVSLFGDMTYEGARSIVGPYLGLLGVTATTIGIVSGFGELMGYGARLLSGYLGDRTGSYWAVTIVARIIVRMPIRSNSEPKANAPTPSTPIATANRIGIHAAGMICALSKW